jgi:ceramide glucosyltransferase
MSNAIILLWRALLGVAVVGSISATIFLFFVLAAALRFRRVSRPARRETETLPTGTLPFISLLKPVHGMEPRLRQNLESFFQQDYPNFEIVFGARSPDNSAVAVVEELRKRYAQVKSTMVFSGHPSWPNAKVFSLDKMISACSSEFFVISDSDVEVGTDFLRNIVPALLKLEVGLLTCIYRGVPAQSFWSSLEALGLSVEMSSGVLVADMLEGMRFALGAVIAVRKDALAKTGGIGTVAEYYSDDFELGNRVWKAGYKVLLSHYVVDHVLIPSSFARTFGHQLRWMKSTRYSRPLGHLGSGLTFAMPFGLLGFFAATALGHESLGFVLLVSAFLNRVVQSLTVGWGVVRDPRALWLCWLYPVRDLFGFVTWVASYTSGTFLWRGERYSFTTGGRIIPQERATEISD